MIAAVVDELTGVAGLRVRQVPDPEPEDGDVLLEIEAAGVGPWDAGFLSGAFPGIRAPYVPGQEVAGRVVVAPPGSGFAAGDRVWGSLFPTGGGLAASALADPVRLAHAPSGLRSIDAAALVITAGTAHEGLVDRGHLKPGERVLVTAASGGVGSSAVQIARALGAHVIGIASRANHDLVRDLGATEVVDYHDADWVGAVRRTAPTGIDLLFDCAGGTTRDAAISTVRPGGRFVSVILQGDQPQLDRGITGGAFAAHVDRRRLEALRELIEAGALRAEVEAVRPLAEARLALEQVGGGHTRGKVVVQVDPASS